MKREELKKRIHLCDFYKKMLLNEVEKLAIKRKVGLLSDEEYRYAMNKLLKGRKLEDWINYYNGYKQKCIDLLKDHSFDRFFSTLFLGIFILLLALVYPLSYTGLITAEKILPVEMYVSNNTFIIINGISHPIQEFFGEKESYYIKELRLPLNTKTVEIVDNGFVVFYKELK